ncbi:hypothetical protein [Rhodoferax sp. TS-BS-61-7]|uniref:hypothetical protein n=1 Tax=Rhodoferax sp. TS-BS-61-7 TaxID=2094194 RepID=UPI0011B0D1CD|nr:hypothetical protein [Rhodoferax sp. TS-BS-61-7]
MTADLDVLSAGFHPPTVCRSFLGSGSSTTEYLLMKYSFIPIICLLLANSPAMADDVKGNRGGAPDSEPVKCYKIVWGSKDTPGLGLTAGQAVTLCSGTVNAAKTALCFVQAWSHPDNDGLGLTAGQAVSLCKSNLLP